MSAMNERRPYVDMPYDDRLPFRVLQLGRLDAIEEVLALASNPLIGQGAFDQAILLRPNARIELRHGARIVRRHDGS